MKKILGWKIIVKNFSQRWVQKTGIVTAGEKIKVGKLSWKILVGRWEKKIKVFV